MKLSDLPQSVRPAVARQIHNRAGTAGTQRPPRTDPYRSQLERDYAKHLELRRAAGEILWWRYEPMRLALGGGCWFKPDFAIQAPDGGYEIHETKGYEREAAMVRLKVAASIYPFAFYLVKRNAGGWKAERVGG